MSSLSLLEHHPGFPGFSIFPSSGISTPGSFGSAGFGKLAVLIFLKKDPHCRKVDGFLEARQVFLQ
jgi:hypothetical protein